MAVNHELFLDWANDTFGAENIKVKNTAHGTEICTHSFFAHERGIEDHKYHLWMNTAGGQSRDPGRGSYRCWKTDAMGSLVKLVAMRDNIPFGAAEEKICGISSWRQLELQLEGLPGAPDPDTPPVPRKVLGLPDTTYEIDSLPDTHFMKMRAKNYLDGRKIPTAGLHVCLSDRKYGNRVVIPYHDWHGNLIWYNARLLGDKEGVLRYLKCEADGITQDDVLYMAQNWPRPGSEIHIMEGDIDAITVGLCGLNGCAVGGKSMSQTQIEMIRERDYRPVLAFDADGSGLTALIRIGELLLEKGFADVSYVRPPAAYKDWNKLYVARNAETVRWYAAKYAKPFTPDTPAYLRSLAV